MRFWFQLLIIMGITVGLGGCDVVSGFFSGGNADDVATAPEGTPVPGPEGAGTPTPAPEGDPNAAAADPNAVGQPDGSNPDGTENFDNPVIQGNIAGDLIQSTSPEERIQQIQRDRPDPFDVLQTTPTIDIPDDVVLNPDENDPSAGNGTGNPEGTLNPEAPIIPPPPEPIAPPPPPPEPATARAVAVTGVVQIGSVPYAIVNAPNEPHSRYVRSGQLLSNGQVLVKRIELFPGIADPVVVLEEFGIEVNRQVGDPPEGTTPATDQLNV